MEIERRFTARSAAPLKVTRTGNNGLHIEGYASVWFLATDKQTEYKLGDGMVERIRRGAFDTALRDKHDVRALLNHSPDQLLGRTSSGTLQLSVDSRGLFYRIDVDPSDPDHQRVLAKIRRGDLSGSSFAFRATKVTWEEQAGGDAIRWVEDVTLYDVGPVTYPAYGATTTGLRAVKEEYDHWRNGDLDFKEKQLRLLKLM